jgi:hypothetical protein
MYKLFFQAFLNYHCSDIFLPQANAITLKMIFTHLCNKLECFLSL